MSRVKNLIEKNGGRKVLFRDLPKSHQIALIHYMSVDGATWAVTDWSLDQWKWGEGCPDPIHQSELRLESFRDIEKNYDLFVDHYGHIQFGVVDIPTKELIQSISEDKYFPEEQLEYYKKSDVVGFAAGWEYDRPTFPVILSPFEDETLQDGWTRFGRYCELGEETVPCLYYLSPFEIYSSDLSRDPVKNLLNKLETKQFISHDLLNQVRNLTVDDFYWSSCL